MYLQQVRFEEGLEYQIEVEDDVRDAMILKKSDPAISRKFY